VLSLFINGLSRGRNFLKSLYFIPYITPGVVAGIIFIFVLHPDGILNMILGWFGLNFHTAWREGEFTARFGAVFLNVWQSLGFNIVIFMAYLQSIPSDYYEAASLDGANTVQSHWHITLPHMRGALWFIFIMGWINGLQRFTDVFILGNKTGSPNRSLLTIVGFIYDQGFGSFSFGMAAAASYVLFVLILIFTLINMKISKGVGQ
jgi:ABC-type sugar transport system permease subunit